MESQDKSRGPLIAAIVLLLLMLYLGSYAAMVLPPGQDHRHTIRVLNKSNYRFGGRVSPRLYWPLEQVDRQLRPMAWAPPTGPFP